jgi:putative glutamine amidotransferase
LRPVVIGITASNAYAPDGSYDQDVLSYVRAVERTGATACVLPNDETRVAALLDGLDALVLGGGVDVDPRRYDGRLEHARSQAGRYRPDRDGFEIALVRAARERATPVLAICRGLQVVNVACGGTLIEDVHEELGAASDVDHRQTDHRGVERSDYAERHTVRVEPQSALAGLLGTLEFPANSIHHQSVRRVGDGLCAVAHTPDGVIEALEATFVHPFFFAVQWHPEELPDDAISRRLFEALAAAGRGL